MLIRHRLLLLAGSGVFCLAFLAVMGYFQMGRVYDAANFGNVNVVPSVLVLNKATLEFGHIRVRVYRHALNTDKQAMKDLEAKIREARDEVEKAFKEYEAFLSDEADKNALVEDVQTFKAYMQGIDHVVEVSTAEDKDEARALLTKYAAQAEAFNTALVKHMQYNAELGDRTTREGAAAKAAATWVNAGVALLGMGAMAVFGLMVVRLLDARLAEANLAATRVAAGDLSQVAMTRSGDELGRLLSSLDGMRRELASTIRDVIDKAEEVTESATSLSGTADQVSKSTDSQANSTSSAAAAVEQLTVSIEHVGTSSDDANVRAAEAGGFATTSAIEVQDAARQIRVVADKVEHTAQQMQRLSDQVQEIGKITTVIRDVADQTNLLALNAAIEAARAGEQGRGFAVVADEVRKLAERTTASVQEISSVIGNIQAGANAAVESMESSRNVVMEVVTTATGATESMERIKSATETVVGSISNISYALREQSTTSTELSRNVESIAQMSEENSQAVASVASTAARLVSVADGLKGAVSRFRT